MVEFLFMVQYAWLISLPPMVAANDRLCDTVYRRHDALLALRQERPQQTLVPEQKEKDAHGRRGGK